MIKTIQSWHDYLCVPRTPRLVKSRDLISLTFQSPWLSLDEWIEMMRTLGTSSISLDLASMFLYMKLFSLWTSGKGDIVSDFLLKTGVQSSSEELLSRFLTMMKADDRLVVALDRDIPSVTKSRAFSKTKPGRTFMILAPSSMSIALNDLTQLLDHDVIDVLGVTAPFGVTADLSVSLREDCMLRVSHEDKNCTVVEEVRAPYVGKLIYARRR